MPFKDKVKQLAYGRKYQSANREKLKEDKELLYVEDEVIKYMRHHLVGRQLFPIEMLPKEGVQEPPTNTGPHKVLSMPVIQTDFDLPITLEKIEEAASKIVESEDTLLLTGEHKGWPCLGIEGLATAKHRNIIKSCGDFERDLENAEKRLRKFGHKPPYSIVTNEAHPLFAAFTNSFKSPYLCSQQGKKDNLLVVKQDKANFVLLMGQDLHVCGLRGIGYSMSEVLAPKIYEPKSICEIQDAL